MTSTPWVPRLIRDRERLAVLVEKYGPPPFPPRPGWDGAWGGTPLVSTRDGWHRCMWCDKIMRHDHIHLDTCVVGREERARLLRLDWPLACESFRKAAARKQALLDEAAALGVELDDTPPRQVRFSCIRE